jgi:hypothetical protein
LFSPVYFFLPFLDTLGFELFGLSRRLGDLSGEDSTDDSELKPTKVPRFLPKSVVLGEITSASQKS